MDIKEKLRNFLDAEGRLLAYPSKHSMQLAALLYLAGFFEKGREYTQQEVNDLLDTHTLFHDPATLRRELFGYRFLGRKQDGSLYWAEQIQPTAETLGIE